jgi:hypothetical protein
VSVQEDVLAFLVALQVHPDIPEDVRTKALALLEEIDAEGS